MPGGHALSAHGAGKLIVKTDGQTKTEKDTYAKLCDCFMEALSPVDFFPGCFILAIMNVLLFNNECQDDNVCNPAWKLTIWCL
jgi:hypothetical protein